MVVPHDPQPKPIALLVHLANTATPQGSQCLLETVWLDITVTTHQRKLIQWAKAMVTSVPVDLVARQLVINLQIAQLDLISQILQELLSVTV